MSKRICTIEGCTEPENAKGLCHPHYYRVRRYGDPNYPVQRQRSRKKPGDPKGWINDQGYRLLMMPGHPNSDKMGRIREHILIMSEYLGRPLLSHENIHHKNGVRNDNRIDNLELWSKSQPPGQRVSDKIRWAQEILETYGNDPEAFE